jgi:hypothetical protein
LIIYILQSKVT